MSTDTQTQKIPNMYYEVSSCLGYLRRLTPKQKRNRRSREQARRRQKRNKVGFSDQTTVHEVPNGQQEDRYGAWMADGIRERRQEIPTPPPPSPDLELDETIFQLEGSWDGVVRCLKDTGFHSCCTQTTNSQRSVGMICNGGWKLDDSCQSCGVYDIVECSEMCGCETPLQLPEKIQHAWELEDTSQASQGVR
jgi:hypothetical protein